MNCRLCSSANLRFKFEARGNDLYQCLDCGFVQVADQPSAALLDEIYGVQYFTHKKYRDLDTLQKENDRRLSLMGRHLKKNQTRVLEFGCGSGDFILSAKKHYEMYGYDVAPPAIEIAKEKSPELAGKLWSGDFEGFLQEEDSFDAIVAWDVVEHLWDPKEVLLDLYNLLKPGGYMFLSTPNIGSLVSRLMGKYWAFMTPPEHLSFFNLQSMRFFSNEKLGADLVSIKSLGKSANLGFVLYKVRRVAPYLIPNFLLEAFENPVLRRISLYVPTGDILYTVIHKPQT